MKKEYKEKILRIIPNEKVVNNTIIKEVPSGTVLLSEGDIPTKLFMIIKGCLRIYFIKDDGTEITSQFFVEGQMVSSFESAMTGTPSRQFIETIEDSILGIIRMKFLNEIVVKSALAKDYLIKILTSRLINYMNRYASFILDNPEKRYIKLLQENPELISRLPQQYIASYLGITPVSLSRIRSRVKKQINNC